MKTSSAKFIKEYSASLRDGDASIFIGAGVSMAAGYPSWIGLLKEIGDELGVSSKDVHDLAALAQWSLNAHRGDGRVKDVINREISVVRETPLEAQLIARLPVRHIWTTNYDEVIERAFQELGRPIQPISEAKNLGRKPIVGSVRLYKMHGTIGNLNEICISTDDYELYEQNRGAFLPVLQSHLTTSSMLFVGVSLVDPNLRHILSVMRSRFVGSGREHFAIVRPPQREDYDTNEEYEAKLRHHDHWADDLHRYGLRVVEIDSYTEIAKLLARVELEVAKSRVWISGSWTDRSDDRIRIVEIARNLGYRLAAEGFSLVTGYGLVIGSASVAGFLEGSRDIGIWGASERLVARPFPQPNQTLIEHQAQWLALRTEMAKLAGSVVVVGGLKYGVATDDIIIADGVIEEARIAIESGRLVIPIGGTGGAAMEIANMLLAVNEFNDSGDRLRPSDDDIHFLMDTKLEINEIVERVLDIIKR